MKHLQLLLTATLLVASYAMANTQISILAGLGFSFGSTAETIGIHIRGDVDMDDTPWGGSINFISYFGPSTAPQSIEGVKAVYRETNLDGHYFLVREEALSAYGLAGLNISTAGAKIKTNVPFVPNINETETQVGLNIGGGGRYLIADNISLAAEIKYILSKFDQLTVSIAGLFMF